MKEYSGNLTAAGLKIGIVISRFNDFLTKQLLDGAIDSLIRHGVKDADITVAWVPGANEIPMAIAPLAKGKMNAIIALGAVVRGATSHADLINSQVSRAIGNIALDTGVPVINGVVVADSLEQAIERCGTKAGNKGWSAGQAAIEMSNLYKAMKKG
jgi:6,7-dimethyl-8-ribityllumazine synthase